MEVSKLHQVNRKQKIQKKILESILYIEVNKKVPYEIVRKIDFERTLHGFFEVHFY